MDDGWSLDASFKDPIPFDLASAPLLVLGEEATDYGIIGLEPTYVRLLQKNGIEAMDERHWKPAWPEKFDWYAMLGLPTKGMSEPRPGVVSKSMVTLPVKQIANPPEKLTESGVERFYGTIELPDDDELTLTTIDGMSGGPIFGFKQIEGEWRYWIVALQSGWIPDDRVIAACYVEPMLRALDRAMEQSPPEGVSPCA